MNSKFFAYVFKLSGQKQIVKSGPIGIPNHKNIVSAKINSDSSMVACADHKSLSIIYDNDIFKYNAEMSPGEEIDSLLWADNEPVCLTQLLRIW